MTGESYQGQSKKESNGGREVRGAGLEKRQKKVASKGKFNLYTRVYLKDLAGHSKHPNGTKLGQLVQVVRIGFAVVKILGYPQLITCCGPQNSADME